jgi:hypothetical protein
MKNRNRIGLYWNTFKNGVQEVLSTLTGTQVWMDGKMDETLSNFHNRVGKTQDAMNKLISELLSKHTRGTGSSDVVNYKGKKLRLIRLNRIQNR